MWKKEYEGFPMGFLRWEWEQRRPWFLIWVALLVASILLLVFTFVS